MENGKEALRAFIDLARVGSILSRKFEGSLGGLGWNDFIVLYHLNNEPKWQLRRVDLAEKVGLTASGVTRLLLPMEKIGLVSREANALDARVSFVRIAAGGKRKLEEAMERATFVSSETFQAENVGEITEFSKRLQKIGGAILWR